MIRRRPRNKRSGCGLLCLACVVSCILLVVNRMIVAGLYVELVSPEYDFPKLRTVFLFVAIVGLLFPEWWLIDWVTEKLRRLYTAMDTSNGDAGE